MKYIDSNGLSHLWTIIKEYVTSAVNTAKTAVGNYTVNGKKISTNPTLGKADVGLGNVDNTADAGKPVSTLQKAYIDNQVGTRIPTSLKGKANGVATLNSDGVLSSDQCPALKTINGHTLYGEGNVEIDLSLYKVVTTLPTTGIDANKIYLVLSGTSGTQNKYTEYIYTADPSGTYSASAWEELGKYTAKVDLTPYVKFTDLATASKACAMSAADKKELDHLANIKANKGIVDRVFKRSHTSDEILIVSEYVNGAAGDSDVMEEGISIPLASDTLAGLLSPAEKTKLGNIASGATADSAMTNAEIDAICV